MKRVALPRAVLGQPGYFDGLVAADTLAKSIKFATKPMKQAVIAPSMVALLYPLNEEVSGYPRAQFEDDLSAEYEKDVRRAFDAGAARVSIDFTEGRLATRADPRNPWTGAQMLPHFIDLINRVLDRFSPEERAWIGIHTCPGGDRASVHSADVPYSDLLPSMFRLNAGYFLIQMTSERDKDLVYQLIGQHSRGAAHNCEMRMGQTKRYPRRQRRRDLREPPPGGYQWTDSNCPRSAYRNWASCS